jgi:hypothetical protein
MRKKTSEDEKLAIMTGYQRFLLPTTHGIVDLSIADIHLEAAMVNVSGSRLLATTTESLSDVN